MNISGISSYTTTALLSKSTTDMIWTTTKLSELRNYAAQKLSPTQIAQKLGCSASDVLTEAAKSGVKLTASSS
jgi:hypothetical protein